MSMKKTYIITGIVLLVLLISVIIVNLPSKTIVVDVPDNDETVIQKELTENDIIFRLYGESNYQLETNTEYREEGFIARLTDGTDLREYVDVINENIVKNGQYEITYRLEYQGIIKILKRTITYINNSKIDDEKVVAPTPTPSQTPNSTKDDLTIALSGDKVMYILKGNAYKELGASAISRKDGNISKKIIYKGEVDTNKIGEYTITYSITNSINDTKTISRKIIVYDYTYNITTKRENNKVLVTINTQNNMIKYISINGEAKNFTGNSITLTLEDDKQYNIKIFDKYNYVKEDNFTLTKPVITCGAVASLKKTDVTVIAKNIIPTKYVYYFNNIQYESTKNIYSISESYTNVKVIVYDKDMNSYDATCSVSENIGYFDSGLKELNYLGWNYYLYVPENVKMNVKKPLIVFLHGSEERGNNLKLLNNYGFAKYIKNGQTYDAFVLIPQLPKSKYWTNEVDTTMNIIKKVVNDYNIDETRISLSGFSLGAIGIPSIIKENQNYFSSVVMIAVGGDKKSFAQYFKDIPVRIYAGEKDTKIGNSAQTKTFVNALKKVNNDVEFTVYKNKPHNIVDLVLKDGKVPKWMIEQKRK